MPVSDSVTYVFRDRSSSVRVEKRFDLPIVFFANQARIPYLGIALPSLKTNDQFFGFENQGFYHAGQTRSDQSP